MEDVVRRSTKPDQGRSHEVLKNVVFNETRITAKELSSSMYRTPLLISL